MKNSNIVRMFAVACLSLVASAAQADQLFDFYNFDTAANAHATAPALVSSRGFELSGNYKMIATASRSYRGDFQKKDMNGIANPDMSILSLQIGTQSTSDLVQIIQLNLGQQGQNQGPFIAVFRPEGTMVFTQFSYKNGQVSDAVFFNSECKLLFTGNLLCAKRFMVQDLSQVNPNQAAMNNTIVGYDLYTRSF